MTNIAITHETTVTGGRYAALVEGVESEMTYTTEERDGQALMVIKHTGVPRELAGHGVGLALVKRAVEDARGKGFKIAPLCTFARAMFERHADWRDVLAE